ncbi:hypothetical protein [Undibacterium rugosum]|uniref:Uncharacterized protein n=1 Tax=Undibacterium rugosum TaxID=2762291 RepID=A0A923IAI8_9BURK|nr:hypothetical protein [Undibacterium rugosum]MBC3936553.1 hypothetical protein [Undibacterium rugosum]MBR7779810.1 hypothetical protein [Undibacterium rugosum]
MIATQIQRHSPTLAGIFVLLNALPVSALNTSPAKEPLLACFVTYAGSTEVIETGLSANPYQIEAKDIQGRFRFKPVMIGEQGHIRYIKIYAYFQTSKTDLPIHQASYFPPFRRSKQAYLLTPYNALYAGEVERELQYHCTLKNIAS